MPRKSKCGEMAFYCVIGSMPWKSAGDTSVHTLPAKYYAPEVAQACLTCTEKKCVNAKGCERYHAALREYSGLGNARRGRAIKQVTVAGMTKTVAEWAAYLHIGKTTLYTHSKEHSLTMAEEIEFRMKEMSK